MPSRLEEALEEWWNSLAVAELVSGRPRFRAKVDDLDPANRIAERLVVSIGIQRNDWNIGGPRVCNVVAEEIGETSAPGSEEGSR